MNDIKLRDAVNRSGFPLQIGVGNLVEDTGHDHGWKVLYTEHSWRSDDGAGFIDLVLEDQYETSVMVVECKRVLESTWVFLVPQADLNNRRYCKAWVTRRNSSGLRYFHWHEMAIDPASPQSGYCVVDGEDPKAKPMLERVASHGVASTESLAQEEMRLLNDSDEWLRMYFSIVVTTATLKVCTFDPQAVSIADGKVEASSFVEVPFVRFHKQLTTADRRTDSSAFQASNTKSLSRAKENTVFVVNAQALPHFLSEFDVDVDGLQYLR